jgi:hypothetical protein
MVGKVVVGEDRTGHDIWTHANSLRLHELLSSETHADRRAAPKHARVTPTRPSDLCIGSVDVVGPWRTAMVTRSESESATIVRIA